MHLRGKWHAVAQTEANDWTLKCAQAKVLSIRKLKDALKKSWNEEIMSAKNQVHSPWITDKVQETECAGGMVREPVKTWTSVYVYW